MRLVYLVPCTQARGLSKRASCSHSLPFSFGDGESRYNASGLKFRASMIANSCSNVVAGGCFLVQRSAQASQREFPFRSSVTTFRG